MTLSNCLRSSSTMAILVFISFLMLLHLTDSTYFMIGNDADPDPNSLNNFMSASGVIFLLNGAVSQSGILFAMSAFLSNNNNVTFQIWRPVPNESNTFQLISLVPYTPSPPPGGMRIDLYLESVNNDQCFEVVLGDRLGVYFPVIPSAVTYTVASGNSIQTLIFQEPDISNPSTVGDIVSFDPLVFPYGFSLAAYMYFNDSAPAQSTSSPTTSYDIKCPPGLRIPQVITTTTTTTTLPPRTGAPGATGATGATGYTGATGVTGDLGTFGIIGLPGSIGATGATGPLGVQGLTGRTGSLGALGPIGPIGVNGSMGVNGTKGVQGPQGLQGAPGAAATLPTTTPIESNTSNTTSATTPAVVLDIGKDQQAPQVDWWRQESLITGVYIWAAILSFLIFVIIIWSIVLCCCYCQLYRQYNAGGHAKHNGHSNDMIDAYK